MFPQLTGYCQVGCRISWTAPALPGGFVPSIARRHSNFFLISLFAAFLLLPIFRGSQIALAQHGAMTVPAGLDTLVRSAGTIVRGHVVSAVVEPHPQFPSLTTVRVTISVARVLKGDAPALLTFRQFVWDTQDAANAAGYSKSSELLLLLNPNSEYGLTSPVGLEQGRFRILRDPKGNAVAFNGRGNAGLFSQLESKAAEQGAKLSTKAKSLAAKPTGPAPLEGLEDAIAALVEVQR